MSVAFGDARDEIYVNSSFAQSNDYSLICGDVPKVTLKYSRYEMKTFERKVQQWYKAENQSTISRILKYYERS